MIVSREAGREIKVSNLTILNAEVDHGGDYVCSASNKAGESVATVQMMLAKPVTTTLQQVERSQVIAYTSKYKISKAQFLMKNN